MLIILNIDNKHINNTKIKMNRSEVNSKTLVYPECINKKEANMVCLSEKCG